LPRGSVGPATFVHVVQHAIAPRRLDDPGITADLFVTTSEKIARRRST
jgi:hypothetical protein